MDILVFKTNIRYKKHIKNVTPHLENIDGITRWNFDQHDKDNILRIEASNVVPASIESLLRNVGYYCEELPD
jgi:copper chaperone